MYSGKACCLEKPIINATATPSSVHHEKKPLDKLMDLLAKVSAVAMGVISAMLDTKLFVTYFALGAVIGLYQYIQDPHKRHGHNLPTSCTQGFMEGLTGVKLPALISLVANLAINACHIEHHSAIYIPVVAISLGAWASKSAAHFGSMMAHQFKVITPLS